MAVPALHVLAGAVEEADGQDEDMVGLTVVVGHFAEWADARRVVAIGSAGGSVGQQENEEKKNVEVGEAVVAIAIEALEKFCSTGTSSKHAPLFHHSHALHFVAVHFLFHFNFFFSLLHG